MRPVLRVAPARAHLFRAGKMFFPGDRPDDMIDRFLMDRYRHARDAAGRLDLTIHRQRRPH